MSPRTAWRLHRDAAALPPRAPRAFAGVLAGLVGLSAGIALGLFLQGCGTDPNADLPSGCAPASSTCASDCDFVLGPMWDYNVFPNQHALECSGPVSTDNYVATGEILVSTGSGCISFKACATGVNLWCCTGDGGT